jgi:hypothetical protein
MRGIYDTLCGVRECALKRAIGFSEKAIKLLSGSLGAFGDKAQRFQLFECNDFNRSSATASIAPVQRLQSLQCNDFGRAFSS